MALAEIAERNGISAQYLEHDFCGAAPCGDCPRSVKGPQGGYRLQKESDQITVAEVVQAFWMDLITSSRGGTGRSLYAQRCCPFSAADGH